MICDDEYYASKMGIAIDFLNLVRDSENTKEIVWKDLEEQIRSIEECGKKS